MKNEVLETWSTLVCPVCGNSSRQTMPLNACLYFWECPSCQTLLKPLPGDCCVFCSYGDVPCPPVQSGKTGASCCAPQ